MAEDKKKFNSLIANDAKCQELIQKALFATFGQQSPLTDTPVAVKHNNSNNDDNPIPPASVSVSFSEALRTARNAKGLSQKQLALKVNVKDTLLTAWENPNSKAIFPNPTQISLLNRTLGIKLPPPLKKK